MLVKQTHDNYYYTQKAHSCYPDQKNKVSVHMYTRLLHTLHYIHLLPLVLSNIQLGRVERFEKTRCVMASMTNGTALEMRQNSTMRARIFLPNLNLKV